MIDDPVQNILDRLAGVKKDGKGWKARCPAHDDHNPSLSITRGEDGRVLLKCFTGCTIADICRAIDVEEKDLFAVGGNKPPKRRPAKPAPPSKVYPSVDAFVRTLGDRFIGRWEYHDQNGRLIMVVVGYHEKDGKTHRPLHQTKDGWVMADPSGPLPLYRLPELEGESTIYVVEGEKCADAAASIGLTATTSSHGSNSAHRSDWTPLAGRDIVILPDNDDAGRQYADKVAGVVTTLDRPARVKIVELPGLSDGEDVFDYVQSERAEFDDDVIRLHIEELARDAPTWTGPDTGGLVTRCLADVQTEPVSWLWPHRLALGKLSILCGDPGLGKSFVTLDWAAKLTTGTSWPDQRNVTIASGDVLLLTAEDGIADTVRPRLEAADANLNHVIVIEGVRRPEGKDIIDTFSLERNAHQLGDELNANDGVRLIIIDPLSAYMGKDCDSHKDRRCPPGSDTVSRTGRTSSRGRPGRHAP